MDMPTNSSLGLRKARGEMSELPSPIARTGSSLELKWVNLALQGGGSHGAFTWGVLDHLLEDERIAFEGISAASAGAINAAVLACGLAEGGRQGAKRALTKLWRRIAHLSSLTPLQPSLADRLSGNHSLDASPAFMLFDLVTRLFSPYQFNPFNYQPAAPGADRDRRLRGAAFRSLPGQTFPLGHQCPHRQDQGVPE